MVEVTMVEDIMVEDTMVEDTWWWSLRTIISLFLIIKLQRRKFIPPKSKGFNAHFSFTSSQ